MEAWLWVLIGIMVVIITILLMKIYILQKSAKEIETAFADRLMTDTNTLIDISTGDRSMRSLANAINRELRKLRAQQHRYQQGDMELKNAVTTISHDLRTPLTAICGYLELLEDEETSEAAGRYIEVIRNRAEMLSQLTEELFQYSVIISNQNDGGREGENSGENNGEKESVVINRVLEESIAAFYTALRQRSITPVVGIPEEKVIRTLDRSALSRVFSNLLNNAVRYSDGDLEITLSETGKITFANRASELDEVQVGKLFDRFYTVEAARKSTGLGLTIARTLMEQMDGTISAEYENGRLTICILLPDK